jgi:hypothetical protein
MEATVSNLSLNCLLVDDVGPQSLRRVLPQAGSEAQSAG